MRHTYSILYLFVFAYLFLTCQNIPPGPWSDFVQCKEPNCVEAAVAVKDALLQSPRPMLAQLEVTRQQGDAHITRWLDVLRYHVFFEEKYGTPKQRLAMRNALLTAIGPYENDGELGGISTLIIAELESLNMGVGIPREFLPISGTYQTDGGELQVNGFEVGMLNFKLIRQNTLEGQAREISPNVFDCKESNSGNACQLRFAFYMDSVIVKTTGNDQTMSVDRTYLRVNFDNPLASAEEKAQAATLLGHWISTTDTGLEIEFERGRYTETYAGEERLVTAYQYDLNCSLHCFETLKYPCINIMGHPDYVVIKADENGLELSGGAAGRGMVFQRK